MSVHVAGMGWVTPLGSGVEEVWDRLLNGENASAETLSSPLGRDYPVYRVPASATAKTPAHPRLRRSSAISRFAAFAGLEALSNADVKLDPETAERTALIFAVSNGGVIYTKRFYHENRRVRRAGGESASFSRNGFQRAGQPPRRDPRHHRHHLHPRRRRRGRHPRAENGGRPDDERHPRLLPRRRRRGSRLVVMRRVSQVAPASFRTADRAVPIPGTRNDRQRRSRRDPARTQRSRPNRKDRRRNELPKTARSSCRSRHSFLRALRPAVRPHRRQRERNLHRCRRTGRNRETFPESDGLCHERTTRRKRGSQQSMANHLRSAGFDHSSRTWIHRAGLPAERSRFDLRAKPASGGTSAHYPGPEALKRVFCLCNGLPLR